MTFTNGDIRRHHFLYAALVGVVTWWCYRAAAGFDFVAFDDDINIVFNPHLGPPDGSTLRWMFTDFAYMRRYIPLGWAGFSLAYAMSDLSPTAYHLCTLALHTANAVLLYALIRRLLGWSAQGPASWIDACALIAAAAWSLHPLRAETVGWASGLLYSQAACLALASLTLYARTFELPPASRGRRARWWLAVALYAGALLTYPITLGAAVFFPAIHFAWWRRPAADGTAGVPLATVVGAEKLAFLLPAIAAAACNVAARYHSTSFWPDAPSWREFGLLPRVMQACHVWAVYLWRTVWPGNLTPVPTELIGMDPWAPRFLVAAVAVCGLTVGAILWRRARPGIAVWWLAYLAVLAPMAGFTERPHFAADRYAYLPGMLMALALAVVLARVRAPWRGVTMAAAIIMVAAHGWQCASQLRIWTNTDTLMARIVALSENDSIDAVYYRRWALFHAQRGRPSEAARVLTQARNEHARARWVDQLEGELAAYAARAEGIESSGHPRVEGVVMASWLHAERAMDFSRRGRVREAVAHFEAALRLDPELRVALYNYAVFAALSGEARQALRLYLRLAANPSGLSPADLRQLRALVVGALQRRGIAVKG